MKSFFFPPVSKSNVLMAIWLLSITTFNLTAVAAPQDVCVKTESGEIVCGKPVPKPKKISPNQSHSDETIQTAVDSNGGVVWDLKSCVRKQSNVSCIFSFSSSNEGLYGVAVRDGTKLVDASGNDYSASKISVGKRSASAGQNLFTNIAKGAHYKAILDFNDVPNSIPQVVLLQIQNYSGQMVQFRNVPIN